MCLYMYISYCSISLTTLTNTDTHELLLHFSKMFYFENKI